MNLSRLFKPSILTLAAASALIAQAAPITTPTDDIKAGTDMVARLVGGSANFNVANGAASATVGLPPLHSFHVAKVAGTLNANIDIFTLFPSFGVHNTIVGTASTTSNGFVENLSDPTLIGKTVTVTVGGHQYTMTVTSFTGEITVVASHLAQPLGDPFDHNARSSAFSTSQASIVIKGTTTFNNVTVPVVVSARPLVSGIGGQAQAQFVKLVSFGTGQVASGVQYTTGQVTLFATPGGTGQDVSLTSSGPITLASPTTHVNASATTASFTYTGGATNFPQLGVVTASIPSASFTQSVKVVPLLSSFTSVNPILSAGANEPIVVYLSAGAPTTENVSVSIVDADATLNTGTLVIPAGHSYGVVYVQTSVSDTSFTIQATLNGAQIWRTFLLN